MASKQSDSFSSYIRGPFKEKHENGQQIVGMDELVKEAENFAQKQKAEEEEEGEGPSNLLGEKAAFLRKLEGTVNFEVRKTLHGHLSKVSALDWAGDSHSLVSASQDGKMIIWDGQKAFKLFLIPLRSAWVMTCAFAHSGSFVACGGLDNVCSVYSLHTMEGNAKLVRELVGHDAFVACCKFVDEGRQMLTASGDRKCALWEIETGKAVRIFSGHTGGVMSIAALADSNGFVSASCDNSAKFWDIRESGKCVQTFAGHSSDINAVQIFPNGQAFATGSDDATCKMFHLAGSPHQELATYKIEGRNSAITSLAFSNSGRLLFAGSDDFNCLIWDSMRVEKAGALIGHNNRISCLGIPRDGSAICTGSWDNLLKIWN